MFSKLYINIHTHTHTVIYNDGICFVKIICPETLNYGARCVVESKCFRFAIRRLFRRAVKRLQSRHVPQYNEVSTEVTAHGCHWNLCPGCYGCKNFCVPKIILTSYGDWFNHTNRATKTKVCLRKAFYICATIDMLVCICPSGYNATAAWRLIILVKSYT